MTPTEFVAGLAEVMEVERTGLATVDRALAKAGLRQIARGRFHPDVTLEEGLQIAFAWAGGKNLTMAAEEIERLRRFKLVEQEPIREIDPAYLAVFGGEPKDLEGKDFIEVSAIVARNLGAKKYKPNDFWVTIEKDGGVEIRFATARGHASAYFFYFGKPRLFSPCKVRVTVSISGSVLLWIFQATEGA